MGSSKPSDDIHMKASQKNAFFLFKLFFFFSLAYVMFCRHQQITRILAKQRENGWMKQEWSDTVNMEINSQVRLKSDQKKIIHKNTAPRKTINGEDFFSTKRRRKRKKKQEIKSWTYWMVKWTENKNEYEPTNEIRV